jgi:hypothetical protein
LRDPLLTHPSQELQAQDLQNHVQKVSLQLQQLSAKCVVQAELDALRQRVNVMQEMVSCACVVWCCVLVCV